MQYDGVLDYIESYWLGITRENLRDQGTLIGLPRPYIVPSRDPIFQEMYYWDSYFVAAGLRHTRHERRIVDLAENCLALLKRFGMIPTGSRFYLLSRSQPPFSTALFRLAFEVKKERGDGDAEAFLASAMAAAVGEHESVWLGEIHPHLRRVHRGLSRYFDANGLHELANVESGWDRATRCDDRWLDHLPVCLNSILYRREMDFAWHARMAGRADDAEKWNRAAASRAETMTELMWDESRDFFFDYDYVNGRRHPEATLAGFYPMWAGMVSQEQADRMVGAWLDRFRHPGGLVTSLRKVAGHQFGWPNGWASLIWLVVQGLDRYGFTDSARGIACDWCDACAREFARTGKMWEKYNVVDLGAEPEDDRYGSVDGFAWTNALFLDLARRGTSPG